MKPGDKVRIKTKDRTFEGILVDKKELATVIKLDNGYNIGIDNSSIIDQALLEKGQELKISYKSSPKTHADLPTLSILHTGGTIASKVDYRTGAVFSSFKPEDLLGMFPELSNIANIRSNLIGNMWSEDMRFNDYSVMANMVDREIAAGSKGIILTQGTDTLGYTAAALSFILENVPVPVVIVGAQRSSDRGSSDAGMNLICAAEFARSGVPGVFVCMHAGTDDTLCHILPGPKVRKLHTSRRDAFQPVNASAVATVDYETRKIVWNQDLKASSGEFVVKDRMEDNVALLKVHPNMHPEQFAFFKGYKGLVIEGTGLGHAPINPTDRSRLHEDIKKAIADLVKSGTVVCMASQCIFGRVQMDVYSTGRDLQDIGVIPCEDMLPETAFVKLAWLLANDPGDVTSLMRKDLRGEISPCISRSEYLD